MIDLDGLYFDWLLSCLNPDGVTEGTAHVSFLLHNCDFLRRVGNDINRAVDGANLRKEFIAALDEAGISPHVTNDFMMQECSWLEMLVALARNLDYLYEGSVEGRFLELVENMGLGVLLDFNPRAGRATRQYDQHLVDFVTNKIDDNRFDRNGHGGLFPLKKAGHPNQREVEIWEQHAAYFRERLEGVLWTSTK